MKKTSFVIPDSSYFYTAMDKLSKHGKVKRARAAKGEQARYKLLEDGSLVLLVWMRKRLTWKVIFPDQKTTEKIKGEVISSCSLACARVLTWEGSESTIETRSESDVTLAEILALLREILEIVRRQECSQRK